VTEVSYAVNSLGSFPVTTLNTNRLAIASVYSGAFASACSNADCASSVRPR